MSNNAIASAALGSVSGLLGGDIQQHTVQSVISKYLFTGKISAHTVGASEQKIFGSLLNDAVKTITGENIGQFLATEYFQRVECGMQGEQK